VEIYQVLELIIEEQELKLQHLGFGGSDPSGNISNTILYDGTSWATTSGTLGTPRGELGGTGTSSLALAAGGDGASTATEEYTGAAPATKTITVS
jgi:hypothetical protein